MAKEDSPASESDLSKINVKEEDQQLPSYQLQTQTQTQTQSQLPFIDFSLLTSSAEELDKFKSALSSWGCCQLINHGIPREFLDEVREMSREFFRLPMEEKRRYAMLPGGNNGFESFEDGTAVINNDPDHVPIDWNEGLNLTVYPEDRRLLEFWPEKPPKLGELLHEYTMKSTSLFDTILDMVLRSLNVDEKKFGEKYCKNKEINVRLNFYPQCPNPEKFIGLKPHADFSPITIVLQDEVGLQVLKDGEWFTIPVVPDALFVNIGDPLEIMSNGTYKSAVHRVVTNPEKSRVSIALFWDSDRNCEIGPLDELVTPDRPQLYKTVSLEDYLSSFFNYYRSGQRAIDSIRI